LGQRHTMEHLLNEQYIPVLADRRSHAAWQQAGSKDIVARARERVEDLLDRHSPAPMDGHMATELDRIVEAAQAQALG
jgi:trimethylamine--corrinoid protein Co-methyltransferase